MIAGPALGRQASWPSMAVTLTVPFSPGGGTDLLARSIAEKLADQLQVSAIVENKPGAAGNIGAELVARDTSNHRFLFTTASIAVNQSLYQNLRYKLVEDLQPISMLTSSPLVLAVPGTSSVTSLEQLSAAASKRNGGLNYGSPGTGTTSHLGCAVLTKTLGFPATHIPYKGAAQVSAALMSSEIDFAMIAAVAAAPHLRSGAIRAIGIAGKHSPPSMERVPLLVEIDPQLEFDNWQALFAPKSLSTSNAQRLAAELRSILQMPDVAKKISNDGATPLGLTPPQTAEHLAVEIARYRKIVAAFSISVT